MFWIALELSIPKTGFNIMLSSMVKKLDAFKFDGVAESDNTGGEAKIFRKRYYQSGSCHKRQKAQAPTPRAPIRNRQTRKVANAKVLNRNTNLT